MKKHLIISAVFFLASMMLSAQGKKIQHGFQLEFGVTLISGNNEGNMDNAMGASIFPKDKTDHQGGYAIRGLYNFKYKLDKKLYLLTGLGITYHHENIFGTNNNIDYLSLFLSAPILLEFRPVKFFALEGGMMLSSCVAQWNG